MFSADLYNTSTNLIYLLISLQVAHQLKTQKAGRRADLHHITPIYPPPSQSPTPCRILGPQSDDYSSTMRIQRRTFVGSQDRLFNGDHAMVWDVVVVREGIQSWAGTSQVVGPRLDKSVCAGDIDELVGVESRCVYGAFSRQHPRTHMD